MSQEATRPPATGEGEEGWHHSTEGQHDSTEGQHDSTEGQHDSTASSGTENPDENEWLVKPGEQEQPQKPDDRDW